MYIKKFEEFDYSTLFDKDDFNKDEITKSEPIDWTIHNQEVEDTIKEKIQFYKSQINDLEMALIMIDDANDEKSNIIEFINKKAFDKKTSYKTQDIFSDIITILKNKRLM